MMLLQSFVVERKNTLWLITNKVNSHRVGQVTQFLKFTALLFLSNITFRFLINIDLNIVVVLD